MPPTPRGVEAWGNGGERGMGAVGVKAGGAPGTVRADCRCAPQPGQSALHKHRASRSRRIEANAAPLRTCHSAAATRTRTVRARVPAARRCTLRRPTCIYAARVRLRTSCVTASSLRLLARLSRRYQRTCAPSRRHDASSSMAIGDGRSGAAPSGRQHDAQRAVRAATTFSSPPMAQN